MQCKALLWLLCAGGAAAFPRLPVRPARMPSARKSPWTESAGLQAQPIPGDSVPIGPPGSGKDNSEELDPAAAAAEAEAEAVRVAEEKLDDAMGKIDFGRYQLFILLVVGAVHFADGAEISMLALVNSPLAERFGLVSWEKGILPACVYSGMFISGIFSGPLADSMGRKFTLVLATAVVAAFGLLSTLANSFWILCLLRFIVGVGTGASIPTAASFLQEKLPAAVAGALSCLVFVGFNFGETFMAACGSHIFAVGGSLDPVKLVFILSAIPAAMTCALAAYLPESPQFLASRGRPRALGRWFRWATNLNKQDITEVLPRGEKDVQDMIVEKPKKKRFGRKGKDAAAKLKAKAKEPVTMAQVLGFVPKIGRSFASTMSSKFSGIMVPELRFQTARMWILWLTNNLVFYGLIFCMPEMLRAVKGAASWQAASTFDVGQALSLTSALPSIIIFPVAAAIYFGIRYAPLLRGLGGAAVISLASALYFGIVNVNPVGFLWSITFAKLFFNGSFDVLYPASAALYPTAVRATGTSMGSTVGRLCAILVGPIFTTLMDINKFLPIKIMLGGATLAVLATFGLRFETSEDTEEEAPTKA